MNGERDLNKLLSGMRPETKDGEYVFCSVDRSKANRLLVMPRMLFDEDESTTIVLPREDADDYELTYGPSWSLVTLGVYSDLEAVGFLASVLSALAEAAISVNVVSAYHHDHVFVPKGREKDALSVLEALSREAMKKK